MTVTLADQIACVNRELRMRERVYGRRVAEGRMSREQADREIAAMKAVLHTLKGLDERERLI